MLSVNADPLVLPLSDLVAAVYQYLNLAFLLDATGVYVVVRGSLPIRGLTGTGNGRGW